MAFCFPTDEQARQSCPDIVLCALKQQLTQQTEKPLEICLSVQTGNNCERRKRKAQRKKIYSQPLLSLAYNSALVRTNLADAALLFTV